VRLTVETGPLAGTTVSLERDRSTTLGSGPDCTLRIQEEGVAAQHAVVKALKGSGFGVKALDGTLRVNGADVQASPLQDGDVLEIGATRIAFGEPRNSSRAESASTAAPDDGMPKIAGYRILDVLGQGGMGTVYRAEQVSLHRQVALKVLNRAQMSEPSFVDKFVAEARAAAKLQHPNVVSVFDVEHDGDTYYYAMELMHEGSCEDWLKQNGAMPVDRALQVVADAAAGLAYAESLGIVHRDIKPDNLMLDQHGAIKIADLGLAHTGETTEQRAIGTPHFMAPEQVLNKSVDHRTDLYSLGCTFYRLVTGKTPFRGKTVKDILRAQVKDAAEPASKANADVPAEVSEIIARLMAKEPADRYQTANELLEELEALLQPPQKRGLWIGLAVVAVLFAGGAIYWAVNKPKEKEIVERVYDDPEKQEFADRIKVLEAEAKEKDATIALLSVRASELVDEPLAAALESVAAEHAGTPAATEAATRADAIRRDVARKKQERELRRTRIAEHLGNVRRGILQPLDAFDYTGALRALAKDAPADLAGDDELQRGVDKLRDEVVGKARERLAALRAPLAEAQQAGDEQAIADAITATTAALAPESRWPEQVGEDLRAVKAAAAAAENALAELRAQRIANSWQQYDDELRLTDGFSAQIARLEFAAAAGTLQAFAGKAAAPTAADRATRLAAWTRNAEAFASALAAAATADGDLQLTRGDDVRRVVRWDRAGRKLMLRDDSRRGGDDEPLATTELGLEHWTELAEQVPTTTAPPHSRECFLALLSIHAHATAAAAYLRRLDKANDESGLDDDAFPLGTDSFDQLLARLPADADPIWGPLAHEELQAGLYLTAGLRALSERRNLAAAAHIDKLLGEHPHSVVVAMLP